MLAASQKHTAAAAKATPRDASIQQRQQRPIAAKAHQSASHAIMAAQRAAAAQSRRRIRGGAQQWRIGRRSGDRRLTLRLLLSPLSGHARSARAASTPPP
jgi:hypothetical protein